MLNGFFNRLNKTLNTSSDTQEPTSLPYPEEPPNYSQNITGQQLLQQFFVKYFVPEANWNFWRTVTVNIDRNLPYPAGMVSETKTLTLKPEYTNPGILAHEFSHLSYAQLSEAQKASFNTEYNTALQTDELLKLLYSQKQYMKSSIIEAHAEIFRYLGNKMPYSLKKYYPFLIGGSRESQNYLNEAQKYTKMAEEAKVNLASAEASLQSILTNKKLTQQQLDQFRKQYQVIIDQYRYQYSEYTLTAQDLTLKAQQAIK